MSSADSSKVEQVAMFDALSDRDLDAIVKAGTRVNLPQDWSLIWDKTPADKAYIILEGEVSIRKKGQEVARLGAGNIVGETAIVDHKLRNATVVTLTPVRVLHFTREAVVRLCEELPAFREALQVSARGRLGETAGA